MKKTEVAIQDIPVGAAVFFIMQKLQVSMLKRQTGFLFKILYMFFVNYFLAF